MEVTINCRYQSISCKESLENVLEAWNGSITTITWSQRTILKSMTYVVSPEGSCLVTYDTPIWVQVLVRYGYKYEDITFF